MEKLLKLNTVRELYNFMEENINYGFVDSNGNAHLNKVPTKDDVYFINDPKTTLDKGCGLCLDQVEVEKTFFKNKNIPFKEYIVGAFKNGKIVFHVFLVYEDNNKFYWFERSYSEEFNGIKKYDKLADLFGDVKKAFIKREKILKEYEKTLLIADCTSMVHPGLGTDDWLSMQKDLKNIA